MVSVTKNGEGLFLKPPPEGGAALGKKDIENRQQVIGDRLRRLYDDVVHEPVPDDFLKLLEEADAASSRNDADEDEDEDSESRSKDGQG